MRNVMTIEEAAEAWGVPLEKAKAARFPYYDSKYSGKVLLVTALGMNTLFGLKHKIPTTVKLRDVYTVDEAEEIYGTRDFPNIWLSGGTELVTRADMESVIKSVHSIVTRTEAVKRWGVSRQTLHRAAGTGKLEYRKAGSITLVTASSLNVLADKAFPICDDESLDTVFTFREVIKQWRISYEQLSRYLKNNRIPGAWKSAGIWLIPKAGMDNAFPGLKKVRRQFRKMDWSSVPPAPESENPVDIFTMRAAAEVYGVSYEAVQKYLPVFEENELRRSQHTVLITRAGLERVFHHREVKQVVPIDDAFILDEAANRWGLSRKLVEDAGFGVSEKIKSGRVWIITRAGMERVFGHEKAVQSPGNQ